MAELQGSFGTTMFMCVYYVTIGSIGSLCNLINLRIYNSSSEIRRKYLYFIAFECGELINSISFILTGAGRMKTLLNGTMSMPITAHICFYERFWVHSLIVGVEVPTLILILISFERICAVVRPSWYNLLFSTRRNKFALLAITVSFTFVSLIMAGMSAWHNPTPTTGHCPIISSTQQWYSTTHFSFVVISYFISFVSLLVMYFYRKKFASNSTSRGDSKTKLLISFTGSAVLLEASPSVVMIGIRWNVWAPDDVIVALTYSTTAWVSMANTAINFTFREEFRWALAKALRKIGVNSADTSKRFHASHASTVAHTTATINY